MKGSTAMWNYDAVDKKEAERMASLYGEDATRTVEHGTEAETGELLVRSCGNELGFATWEAFDFERNTWLCEAFENREAAELWLSGEEVDTCFELDDQLVQSTKRMAALAANMSGGRWTAGIHEYKDGRKSLSFQLSDDAGFTKTSACAPRRASICGPSPRKSSRPFPRPSPPKRSPRRHAGPSTRLPELP